MNIDLLPTIAKLTGAKLPEHKIDGLDVWPLFAGDSSAKNPHEAYYHYYGTNELQAVRSGDWKLFFPHTARSMIGQAPGKDGIPGKYKGLPVAHELYNHVQEALAEVEGKRAIRLRALIESTIAKLGQHPAIAVRDMAHLVRSQYARIRALTVEEP